MHYNAMHGSSVAEAAGSGKIDALLVVGVFFELGVSGEPQALTTIAENVIKASKVSPPLALPPPLSPFLRAPALAPLPLSLVPALAPCSFCSCPFPWPCPPLPLPWPPGVPSGTCWFGVIGFRLDAGRLVTPNDVGGG